tara:strand:- start:418 stop:624 length:207 start_codon:yes stop_codon:yes gene_type:complete
MFSIEVTYSDGRKTTYSQDYLVDACDIYIELVKAGASSVELKRATTVLLKHPKPKVKHDREQSDFCIL